MSKREFLELVRKELDHIKKEATKEEVSRLDFRDFHHGWYNLSIAKQLTSNYSRYKVFYKPIFEKLRKGKYIQNHKVRTFAPFYTQSFQKGENFTALEKYFFMTANKDGTPSEQHKNIFDYLKNRKRKIIL